jgi:hypothetical protein
VLTTEKVLPAAKGLKYISVDRLPGAKFMRIRAALVAAGLAIFGAAHAETLLIPDEPQSGADAPATFEQGATEQQDLPLRGMSMNTVESRFGAPREKLGPVGEPPITRWVYADYTVYFEGRYVIHTVRAGD